MKKGADEQFPAVTINDVITRELILKDTPTL